MCLKFILSSRITFLRKENRLTQSECASLLGINRVTYAGYESGRTEMPFSVLLSIADLYNVSLDYLFGRNLSISRLYY